MQETQVPSLGQEDPQRKEMATHCSILSWEIPLTEDPGGLQSMGHKRVGDDSVTEQQQHTLISMLCLFSLSDIQILCAGPSWKSLQWCLYSGCWPGLFAFSLGKETKGNFSRTVTTGGFFIPAAKMHSTSTGSSCDLSKQEGEWGQEGMPAGAEGGFDVSGDRSQLQGTQARAPPEQLKVFRPIEDPESEQTAPKMLGMFYTSHDSPSRSVITSSLFQMEPSPRHQRKALNISKPFAVSVPLRVSAVISTNSTPCRTPPKELQSLSSLEEFSFQGSESGEWPEEEKSLSAETSTGKKGGEGLFPLQERKNQT